MSETTIHKAPSRWPLVVIAIDKLAKGLGLLIISFALTPSWHERLTDWVTNVQLGPHNWLMMEIFHWIESGLGYPPHTLHLIRIGVIVYAGLYVVEGMGLMFEQKWAEWVVVIATAASLPVEIFDFIRRPSWAMLVLFVLNLLMAGYLLWRLRREAELKREKAAQGASAGPAQVTAGKGAVMGVSGN